MLAATPSVFIASITSSDVLPTVTALAESKSASTLTTASATASSVSSRPSSSNRPLATTSAASSSSAGMDMTWSRMIQITMASTDIDQMATPVTRLPPLTLAMPFPVSIRDI